MYMTRSIRRAAFALAVLLPLVGLPTVASAAVAGPPAGPAASLRPAGLPASAKLVNASAGLPDGIVYIVNVWTRKCLDATWEDGGGNGTRVQLWDCNGSSTERWFLGYSHRTDAYSRVLINDRRGYYLDYPAESGGNVGWQFQLWAGNLGATQSLWFFPRSDDVGNWEISVASAGGAEVMDASVEDGGVDGNRVALWWITGHPAQRWAIFQS
jgi:hypothetical protein